jgi:hypothetical protein
MTTKPSHPKLRRTPLKGKHRAIRRYAIHTGEVIWAWNQLHYVLNLLFLNLATPENKLFGHAMWHSLRSDNSQRSVLRAALQSSDIKSERISDGLEWLLDAIDKLAPARNDATHAPTIPDSTKFVAIRPLANPTQATRLMLASKRLTPQSDMAKFHRALRDDLYVLAHFGAALLRESEKPGKFGRFPAPPLLQSIPLEAYPKNRSQKKLAKLTRQRTLPK